MTFVRDVLTRIHGFRHSRTLGPLQESGRRSTGSHAWSVLCRAALFVLVLANASVRSLRAAEEATPAAAIHIHDGFAVERVYSVPRAQGSWVAMCFDDRGRIYASDQGPRLFRITPPALGDAADATVEVVSDQWGFSQGMAFIRGSLYVIQHGSHDPEHFRPDVLLRLKDTDGDDRLDTVEQLIEFPRATGDAATAEHAPQGVPVADG